MRILFLSHYFPPEGNAPASRTWAHARRWASNGHDVTVVTCNPHHPTGILYPGYRNSRWRRVGEMDGVRVVRVWTWLAANAGTWRRLANYLSYLATALLAGLCERRPDVIVATSPQFFCGWAGALLGGIRRVPFVLEVRDLWPASIAAVGALRSRTLLRLVAVLERGLYQAAVRIVTVGEGYRDALLARGCAREHISIVTNGVDHAVFHPRPRDPQLARRLAVVDRFVVVYCGTIGMAHGLEVVVRAAERLRAEGRRQIVFVLAGAGARLAALRDQVARRQLDNVVFSGQIDPAAVPAMLALADVCLVHLRRAPAFETVLPSKMLEAAAMARPIVLGVRGRAQRFVEAAGCGLCIEPEDERELAAAILRLAADPELRARLGSAGAAAIGTAFDRDRLAAQYIEILMRTAAEARRG